MVLYCMRRTVIICIIPIVTLLSTWKRTNVYLTTGTDNRIISNNDNNNNNEHINSLRNIYNNNNNTNHEIRGTSNTRNDAIDVGTSTVSVVEVLERKQQQPLLPSDVCGMKWSMFVEENKINTFKKNIKDNLLLWTVSGGVEYRNHIQQLLDKYSDIIYEYPIIVIALDEETAYHICTNLHYNAIYWDIEAQSYSRVADSKFHIASYWSKMYIKQLFIELDIFCKISPIPLFIQHSNNNNADIVTIGHGDVQTKINIGMFYIEPSTQITDFFDILTNILLHSKDERQYIHRKGERNKVYFDQDTFQDCLQVKTRNVQYYTIHDTNYTNDLLRDCHKLNIRSTMISNLYINSYLPPTVHDSTICIHPLDTRPFTSFKTKLATAKFLGFDPVPIHDNQRLLKTLSGDIVFSEQWGTGGMFDTELSTDIRKQKQFQYHIATMIALAQDMNRILVLPRYLRDSIGKAYPVFSLVSTASISEYMSDTSSISWRFVSYNEAQQLQQQYNQSIIELPTDINDDDNDVETFTKNIIIANSNCDDDKMLCAVHGLYRSRNYIGKNKRLQSIIEQLTWCFKPPSGKTTFEFVRSIGSYQLPCVPE